MRVRCAFCGEEFTGKRKGAIYCSARCRRDRYAHSEEARGHCENCGTLLGTRAGGRPRRWCADCWHARQLAATAERGHRIEQWWAQGLTLRQIGERLGWTSGHVGQEVLRLRAKGFDLPKRRPYYGNGHTKVAA